MAGISENISSEEFEEEIVSLLQTRRYDPEILPRLEEYVKFQISHGSYDTDANLAVLKLYQFYPEHYNPDTVWRILIKALMALPSSDFLCCLYLIPETHQKDPHFVYFTRLAELLETCKFGEFWKNAKEDQASKLLQNVRGFDEGIRSFIAWNIQRTFEKISPAVLMNMLNLDPDSLDPWVKEKGWKKESDHILLPLSEDNQPKPKKIGEQITFKQVNQIF